MNGRPVCIHNGIRNTRYQAVSVLVQAMKMLVVAMQVLFQTMKVL